MNLLLPPILQTKIEGSDNYSGRFKKAHDKMEKIYRRITDNTYVFTAGQHMLVLIGLIVYSFFVYRHGIVDVFNFEHANFLRERDFFSSNWEFFRHGISFDHKHTKSLGLEAFLFRPGVTGGLALQAIIFGANLMLQGAFSILLHSLAAFSLYFLLTRLINPYISLGLATVFATQYTGIDLILWRHVSLYIVSVIFFIWALYFISRLASTDKPRLYTALSSIFFIISALFHETVIIVLILSGLFIAFVRSPLLNSFASQNNTPSGKRRLLIICFAPVIAYMCLSITDYFLIYGTSLFSFIKINQEPSAIKMAGGVKDFFLYAGTLINSFIFPYVIDIAEENRFPRVFLTVLSAPRELYLTASGALFLVLLGSLAIFLAMRFIKSSNSDKDNLGVMILLVFSMSYVLANIAGVVFGRIMPKGFVYIQLATYYFYLANYVMFILLVCGIIYTSSLIRIIDLKKISSILLIVLFGAQIIYNYNKVQDLLKPKSELRHAVGNLLASIDSTLNRNKKFCFSGFNIPSVKLGPNDFDISDPLALLPAGACTDENMRLYGMVKEDGSIWMGMLRKSGNLSVKPVTLDLKAGNFSEEGGIMHSTSKNRPEVGYITPDETDLLDLKAFREGRGMVLSKGKYAPAEIHVTIQNPSEAGLLFAYKDADNFAMFGARRKGLGYFKLIKDGVQSSVIFLTSRFIPRGKVDISIRKVGDVYALFYGDYLISELYGITSLEGRVGLFDFESGAGSRQAFANLAVIDNNRSGHYGIEPVYNLNIPRESRSEIKNGIDSFKSDFHNNLATAYINKGRYGDAERELAAALRYMPDAVRVHNNLGAVYLMQERYDEAIKEFQTALRYKPDDAAIHQNLLIAYDKKNPHAVEIFKNSK